MLFLMTSLTPFSQEELIISEALIVIGSSEGTPRQITKDEFIKVMKGYKPRWNNGTKAKIALMKPKTTVGTLTAKKIYGMTSTELSKYWLAMVFEGKSSPPEFFSDEADLIKYVSKTEGAIGIISQNQPNINIVIIDGMAEI